MQKIKIEVKHAAKDKEVLDEIANIKNSDVSVEIVKEEQSKEPTVSKSSLGAYVQQAIDAGNSLIQADSVVRIFGEAVMLKIGSTLWNLIVRLIKSNNRKKGNAIGAKISLEANIDGKIHVCDFICDNISETELETALSKIQPRLDELKQVIGEEYLNQIKNMAFTYDLKEGWKLAGAEKYAQE